MPSKLLPLELRHVERRVRLIQVLATCSEVGMVPVAGDIVHVLAYLTDALAPVWHLPQMNAQLLKRDQRPFFPALQDDLDWLVGAGIVLVENFDYVDVLGEGWRLSATYDIELEAARPVLDLSYELSSQQESANFVREVVLAASGLGDEELIAIGSLDAAYSSETTDVGEVLDLSTEQQDDHEAEVNRSAAVAMRFGDIADNSLAMSNVELVHLYMRHLYTRADVA